MRTRKTILTAFIFSILIFTFAAPQANAKDGEYRAIVNHLKTKYHAKKVKIPFIWLARAAVRVARPAGVKSFSVTMFEDLQFSRAALDGEMQQMMRNSFSADWSPILRVRSRDGEQAYMYMRETGKSVQITLVTIDKTEAAVIRAKFSPDKLAEFINNPKIFGIALGDRQTNDKNLKPEADDATEDKTGEPKKNH